MCFKQGAMFGTYTALMISRGAHAQRKMSYECRRSFAKHFCLDACCSGFRELTETKSCVVVLSYSSVSVSMWFSTSSCLVWCSTGSSMFCPLLFDLPALSTPGFIVNFSLLLQCLAEQHFFDSFFGFPFFVWSICATSHRSSAFTSLSQS